MRRITCLLVVLTALLLGGCATDKKNNALISTLNAYANTLRWGDFQTALQFVDPEVLKAHPPTALDLARYQQVRVSDYDEGNGAVPNGQYEVRQTVRIGLINKNTQGERSVIDQQVWKYDPVKNHWWLETGLPDITQD